jgi:stage VI sporulation protein D
MNRSIPKSLLFAGIAMLVVLPITIADDGSAADEQAPLAEMQEQMQQIRAEMEELRALLRQVIEEQEAVKPHSAEPELPPELAERMQDIKREIQELMQAGREEEANALEQQAAAILREYETQQAAAAEGEKEEPIDEVAESKPDLPPDLAERLETIKREVAELREAGRLDAAENLEREAHQMLERYEAEQREAAEREEEWFGEGEREESRLDHLRAAAEHLEAAGAPDLTERVRGLIEEIEGERRE